MRSIGSPTENPPRARPSKGKRAELLGVRAPQVGEARALDDAEEGLPERAWRGERAAGPARRAGDGRLDDVARGLAGGADVELHLDVGADEALDAHRLLGREDVSRPVEVRLEREALLGRSDQRGAARRERVGLEAARVGEHRVRPAREGVQPAEGRDRLGARAGA